LPGNFWKTSAQHSLFISLSFIVSQRDPGDTGTTSPANDGRLGTWRDSRCAQCRCIFPQAPQPGLIVVPHAGLWHAAPGGRRRGVGKEATMEIGSGGTRSETGARTPEEAASRRNPLAAFAAFHQFFATAAVPCPYLPGRAERKLVVELDGRAAALFYDELSRAGFRRSHRFAYRPACRACTACVPVRIAVAGFADSRSTRRVRNANRGLVGQIVPACATPEQFRLFTAYQQSRHRDGDMAAMTYGDYRSMVEDSAVRTALVEFRQPEGALVAVSLIDRLDDGVSAVYSFFDPAQSRRSLGTWSILWLVEECRRHGLPYVYLGYWIAESPKMAYKARFPALERLLDGEWLPFAES
jgi:leucyl-tRNA---protein transferase